MTVSLIDFSDDGSYKWEYGRTINKIRQKCNGVGPQEWQTLGSCPANLTLTSSNTIYVNLSTGNDTTGDGTSGNPYKTMAKGAGMCTATYPYVSVTMTPSSIQCIDDYPYPGTYNQYFQGCYAASGKTIQWTGRSLGYTPSDSNTIFISKSGSDSNAGTYASPVLTLTGATGAISKCTASKQSIVFIDSGVYDETAFQFTGNFKNLYAYNGCTPTITINQNTSSTTYTHFTSASVSVDSTGTCSQQIIAKFADDSFVIAWVISSAGQFAMYRNNNYCYKSKTQFDPQVASLYAVLILPISENVVFIFKSTNNGGLYYNIYNKNGTVVKGSTQVPNSGISVAGHGAALSDDTWVVCWCDSNSSYGYYFATFDSTGTAVLVRTYVGVGDSGHIQDICCGVQSNDNIIIGFINATGKGDLAFFNSDGTWLKYYNTNVSVDGSTNHAFWDGGILIFSDDSFVYSYGNAATTNIFSFDYNYKMIKRKIITSGVYPSAGSSMCRLKNDNVLMVYLGTGDTLRISIYDKELSELFKTTTILSNISSGYSSCFVNNFGDILVAHCAITTLYLSCTRITDYYFIGINVAVNATMNGITIDCENQDYLKYIFTGASNLTRKWNKFKNQSSTFFDAYTNLNNQSISMLTGQLDRRYDYIHDVTNGDNVTNTVAKSYNCIFLNSDGIDFTVSGTAASADDITYRHNSVQSAGGGFYISNNGGTNETVYDNIFNNVSGYDISATAELTAYNCISTGKVNNITLSSCSTLNPMFINGGEIDTSYADLDLQNTDAGDYFDSPGLLMGSDGKNVGAYNTIVIGPDDSYTSFTISSKPLAFLERNIKFAGAVENQLSDGSYATKVDGASEVITLIHAKDGAMLHDEFMNLLTMMMTGDPNVRLYPSPVTHPTIYWDVTLFYKDTPAHAPVYIWDGTYKCQVKYSFARKITA